MHVDRVETQGWPFLQNVIIPIADWWRKHPEVRKSIDNLDLLGPHELALVAQDVGISASDLRQLSRHSTDAADLLERRLAALGPSPAAVPRHAAAQLRDMARLCTMCESKGLCAWDLAADPADPVRRRYCPNEETLTALVGGRLPKTSAAFVQAMRKHLTGAPNHAAEHQLNHLNCSTC